MKYFIFPLIICISPIHSDPTSINFTQGTANGAIIEELNNTITPQNTANQIAANDLNFISQPAILTSEITPPDPILQTAYKSPSIAAGLSALFPGLGHVYLNDMKTAGGFISSTGLGAGLALSMQSNETVYTLSLIHI